MKAKNTKLFATVACAALVFGMASPAHAFENVDWNWNNEVNGNFETTLDLELDLMPAGLIVMEKTQLQIGDVIATSTVNNVQNESPSESSGFVEIDETFTFNTSYDDSENPGDIAAAGPVSGDQLDGNLLSGTVDEGTDDMEITFQAVGEVYVPDEGALDGIDLPAVESATTAVGNNQVIETTTALQLHDGQFLLGGFGEEQDSQLPISSASLNGDPDEENGNIHTDMMTAMVYGGLTGLIEPVEISATSTVSNILNASVDSSATAVGNNMDIGMDAVSDADSFAIADITQASYADVTASSLVSGVTLQNYGNLGALGGPLVSSTATAVGNNLSLRLSQPDPEL